MPCRHDLRQPPRRLRLSFDAAMRRARVYLLILFHIHDYLLLSLPPIPLRQRHAFASFLFIAAIFATPLRDLRDDAALSAPFSMPTLR